MVLVTQCCGIFYLLSCGKRELFPLLNPGAVISFRNKDDRNFVGIHEKRYLNVFLLLISYSYYCYYKIIFSFNQTKYIICNYFPLPVDSFTVEKKSFLFVVVFVNIPTDQASFSD